MTLMDKHVYVCSQATVVIGFGNCNGVFPISPNPHSIRIKVRDIGLALGSGLGYGYG